MAHSPEEIHGLARALESAIMMCLNNAFNDPSQEDHWRRHADKIERRFTTDYGRHYSLILYPESLAS